MSINWVRKLPDREDSGKFFLVREDHRHKFYCTRLVFDGGYWFTDFPTGNVQFENLADDHADSFMRWRSENPVEYIP